jgi:hypothetical protein
MTTIGPDHATEREVGAAVCGAGFFPRLRNHRRMWQLATLSDQLVTVVAGFVLTTVVGGALGTWFQRRTWDHQNERTLAEAERGHATEVCRELSHLMDKRLYRMRQLNWALVADPRDTPRLNGCMTDYRTVLYEWNDTLNRNLAAAEIQFGHELRTRLERDIYEGFVATGARLEASYRRLDAPDGADADDPAGEPLARELDELREKIYALGVEMLGRIREGRVGRHASQ